MTPPGAGGTHFRATIKLPGDAFMLDFVFSDVPGGDGTYDNRWAVARSPAHLPASPPAR
jgi:starch synthase